MTKSRRFLSVMTMTFAILTLYIACQIVSLRRDSNPSYSEFAPRYTISQVDGQLAVFERGVEEPEIYDVFINTLPFDEQENLKQGVPVESAEQLISLLEDYTS